MRLVRLVALLGSLMLLAATTVSLVNSRAEQRSDQIAAVDSAADIISVEVRANLATARTAVQIAGLSAGQPLIDRSALAAELVSAFEGSEACVGDSVGECTGSDLFALAQMGELAAQAGEDAVAAVDQSSQSVFFVHRPDVEGNAVTVVLRVPIVSLVGSAALDMAETDGVDVEPAGTSRNTPDAREDVVDIDGERQVGVIIGETFIEGSIQVVASVDSDIDFGGDRAALYLTLLGLGTVLLTLAGWTFLIDRKSLQKQASTDDLTGLINRREFERVAEEALDIASRFGTGLCMMVVDLNGFKQVNDTLGHQFGDLVLKASAERLVDAVRDTDVVGRWGGDEFVIMLPGLEDRTAVRNSAERISETLGGTPVVGDTTMTASIGAAIFPRHGDSFDALMRSADVAMYGAKTTGVGHRIADTIEAQDDLMGDEESGRSVHGAGSRSAVDSAGYAGPDRRNVSTEPLPPPQLDTTDAESDDVASGSAGQTAGSESAGGGSGHDERSVSGSSRTAAP